MLSRTHLQNLLRINGASSSDDDTIVRSVLLNARYSKDEVDTAIMILREDPTTNETSVEGLHKVFRTSQKLSPSEISAYLGIQTDIEQMPSYIRSLERADHTQIVIIWFASVILASIFLLTFMYIYRVGFFHPALGLAIFNG